MNSNFYLEFCIMPFMREKLNQREQLSYLDRLRNAVPFLQEIPDSLYFMLDTKELYLPSGRVQEVRTALEEDLNHYVMTYKRNIFNLAVPVDRHLCANIKGASLTNGELKLLQDREAEVAEHAVSLVVYQNPLQLINPAQSDLVRFYKGRGLLR